MTDTSTHTPELTLFGIANCDTVKKAKKFLEAQNVLYQFHDFKKSGLNIETIQQWLQQVPLATLVNKRSTTWRQLSEEQKHQLLENGDLQLLVDYPTLVKRPVLVTPDTILVGFKESDYQAILP